MEEIDYNLPFRTNITKPSNLIFFISIFHRLSNISFKKMFIRNGTMSELPSEIEDVPSIVSAGLPEQPTLYRVEGTDGVRYTDLKKD